MYGHRRRSNRLRARLAGIEPLEPRRVLDASIVISELVADNDGSLLDQHGARSDWIELFNSGPSLLSLAGLYLTDNLEELTKWQFPDIDIVAGGYLVVFASGDDLRDAAEPLHTNFRLSRDGEQVAVVDRDGETILDALTFGEQVSGLSFGRGQETNTSTLVPPSATAEYLIPSAADAELLGDTWTGGQPLVTDDWTTAQLSIGFDVGDVGPIDAEPLKVDFSRDTGSDEPLQEGWEGFFAGGASTGLVTFSYDNDDLAGLGNAVEVSISGNTHYRDFAPATGQFASLSNLLSDGPLCNAACDMVLTLDGLLDGVYEAQTYHHTTQFGPSDGRPFTPFDTTITDGVVTEHLFSQNVLMSDNGSDVLSTQTIPFTVLNGSPVRIVFSKPGGTDHFALPGIEVRISQPPTLLPAITTDIAPAMHGVNASAYIRVPFSVTNAAEVDRLRMKVNYDDGFVAYLNGTEVARRNAPSQSTWSSAATASRSVGEALASELIDLTAHVDALHNGENILAFHALNVAAHDDDFLLGAQLESVDAVGDRNDGYFTNPTPGEPNPDIDYSGFTSDTTFSQNRGIFDTAADAFDVTIESATVDATIVYTVDGSPPTVDVDGNVTNGIVYTAPIQVDRTTTLRALAFKPGFYPTNVDTQTYLFLDDVLDQDSTPPPGYPATWGGTFTDWGMDQNPSDLAAIAGDLEYSLAEARQVIKDSLQSLPTMSLVMDIDDMFGSQNGIYANTQGRGDAWERKVSVEYFDPADRVDGFQIDAGLRIQGFTSRDPNRNPKHSLRLAFRSEYGAGRLNYELFGADGADSFNTLVLRSNSQDAWVYDSAGNRVGQFVRDQWARDALLAMGQVSPRGNWVHLYINGLYWGVYNPTERPDAEFNESYFGRDNDAYEVLKNHEEVVDGSGAAYRELLALIQNDPNNFGAGYRDFSSNEDYFALQGKNPDGADNPDLTDYIDVPSLIDYVIVGAYAAAVDWPGNNYIGRASTDDSDGFHFFMWDNEHGMKGSETENRVLPHSRDNDSPTKFYHALRSNDEFRLEFADRLQWAFFNGGPLYVNPESPNWDPDQPGNNVPAALWMQLTKEIEEALIAEAARWGDVRGIQYTPHDQFQDLRNDLLDNWFPHRSANVLEHFRAYGMYPDIGAPIFEINGVDQHGGAVTAGDTLTMAAAASIVTESTPLITLGGAAEAFVPIDDSLEAGAGLRWYDTDFSTAGWVTGTNGVGAGSSFESQLGTDVGGTWNANSTSLYARFEFELDAGFDVADTSGLELKLKYDDGYVVYLNGQLVHTNANAPSTAVWNSRATGTRANILTTLASVFEKVDLSASRDLLQPGKNVLAIHVVSHEDDLGHVFVQPELNLRRDIVTPAAVFYTLDGRDPREVGGAVVGVAYDGPIALNESTKVNARAFVDGQWSALSQATFVVPQVNTNVLISEIHYNPSAATTAELDSLPNLDNDDFEFIEITNTSDALSINLVGMQFIDGVEFEFGNELLAPGESIVIVEDAAAFQLRYGTDMRIAGQWSGGLSNGGETLQLVDGTGVEIMTVRYDDAIPWSQRADGAGASLELIDLAATPVVRISKPYSWRGSVDFGGSPGSPGSEPIGVVINEVLTHTDPPVTATDSIELFNQTGEAIDIGGWFLSDSAEMLLKYEIPPGTTMGPGEYMVFDESQFNPTPQSPGPNDFSLGSAQGDDVWLVIPSDENGVSMFVDDVHVGGALPGLSFGRVAHTGDRLAPLSSTSLGCENRDPRVGPLVITEVSYDVGAPSTVALAIDPTITGGDLEFVEIYNPTDSGAVLTAWRVRGGVDFDFDVGTSLAAGQTIVVVRFNANVPENADRVAAFRAHYGIDASVILVGGYAGQLANDGERITLERPDESPPGDPLFIPHVIEDEVIYDNLPPWESTAGGQSLTRVSAIYFGNASATWTAASATPGSVLFPAGVAGDLTGDGSVDDRDIDLLNTVIHRGLPAASEFDLTGDGSVDSVDREFLVENILGTFSGDANLDGRVDALDLNKVGINWLRSGDCLGWSAGDFDGDRQVDPADLNELGIHWRFGVELNVARTPRAALSVRAVLVDAVHEEFSLESEVRSVARGSQASTDLVHKELSSQPFRRESLPRSHWELSVRRHRRGPESQQTHRDTSATDVDRILHLFVQLRR